jgi:hypothetical protein
MKAELLLKEKLKQKVIRTLTIEEGLNNTIVTVDFRKQIVVQKSSSRQEACWRVLCRLY